MNPPHRMLERVEQYIDSRRALGYQMKVQRRELLRFARFVDDSGHDGPLTTDLALRWAQTAEGCSRLYQARRIEDVRCLARYLAPREPGTEIPPRGILGPAHRRTQPHIYTPEEIAALLGAARTLRPPDGLRPRTYATLIGLLACTGLRVCEALKLERADVDTNARLVTVRRSKFRKSRLVPLHRSAARMLQEYESFRDHYLKAAGSPQFLVSEHGTTLQPSVVNWTFCTLRRLAGLSSIGEPRRVRLYDLRHTFACRRLLQWYREGRDVNQLMVHLSTYLGHARVTDTYWYLTGIPELMSLAACRFERFAAKTDGGAP